MASIPEDASARSAAEEQQAERAVGAGRQPELEQLSIGELAKLAAVSTRTIRYYEELGILPAPPRTSAGTRRYPRAYVFYLEGAKVLKQLGFGLEEIAELGRFALTGASASSRTQAILQQKQTELSRRIRVLDGLHELVRDAASEHRADESPVTDLLLWVGTENGSTTA